ncbi:MAG TPA: hypothetical protein VEI97_13790, partial [bacterium]|nr:hypothetical protein [bacterium]
MRTTILAFAAVALLGSALACPRPPAPAGKTTPVEKPAPAPADPAPDTAPAITAGVPMKPDGTVDKEALKQFTHL